MSYCPSQMPAYSHLYPYPNPSYHASYPPQMPYMPPGSVPYGHYPITLPPYPSENPSPTADPAVAETAKHMAMPPAYTVPPHYYYPPSQYYMTPPSMPCHPSFCCNNTTTSTCNDPFASCEHHTPHEPSYDPELFAPPHAPAPAAAPAPTPAPASTQTTNTVCQTDPSIIDETECSVYDHSHDCHHDHHGHHTHSHHHTPSDETPVPHTCSHPPPHSVNIRCFYQSEEEAKLPTEAYILRIPRHKQHSAVVFPKDS